MNVVREINKINERELELALQGASWHDEYKDSAYIFIGGLNYGLTEGDVITIFSQYGEVMDVNLPRDKETGKPRGFAFLMYEDQRSTVLAVDNLNGAKVLERTLRVDHVKDYKQKGHKGADGEWVEAEEQSLNARPEIIDDDAGSDSDASSVPNIDPEDPMYDYLLQQWREQHQKKISKKKKAKGKHKDETPEERAARKAKKREKKEKGKKSTGRTDTLKGVEALLQSLVLDAEGTTVLGVEVLYETEVIEIDHGLLRLGALGLQTTRVLVDGVTRGKMIMHGSVPQLDVVPSECLCRVARVISLYYCY
ncbi:unnamed protein product [Peniophora sp. CBMAI 1063]|nr:unnamed protein product [Peniophora sp. CBMAI 1063]